MNKTLSRATTLSEQGYVIEIDGDNGTVFAYHEESGDYICLAQF